MKATKGLMLGVAVAVAVAVGLAGCGAGTFQVKQAGDRFSEDKDPLYLAENNRISNRSIAGGHHIDNKGVYVNPFVKKDAETGDVLMLGLRIINKARQYSDTGGVNLLGRIQSIAFELPDGEVLVFEVGAQRTETGGRIDFNTVSRTASVKKRETGTVVLSPEELASIANAESVSVKITGSKRSVVYEADDISDGFLPNLRQFHDEYVK